LVLSAAGIADPRVWASEPQHVFQTTVYPLDHTLAAANRLENLQRLVLISSGLVAGAASGATVSERDVGMLDFTRVHNVYAEARRAAESLAHGFASQYRLPLSTVRPFTFLGPYQHIDAPWALNNFIRDALGGHEIRITGDGGTRRSYLYGSDVAAWLLRTAVAGQDGGVYNIGGAEAVTHAKAARLVGERIQPEPRVVFAGRLRDDQRSHDFVPDLSHTQQALGVRPTMGLVGAVERTLHWHAVRTGQMRRLRIDGLQAAP
jgi:nucleoside-diphosphate-sugar epimerase